MLRTDEDMFWVFDCPTCGSVGNFAVDLQGWIERRNGVSGIQYIARVECVDCRTWFKQDMTQDEAEDIENEWNL
jgi:hypothetical protein